MTRVTIIDRKLVIGIPLELIEVPDDERVRPTILEMVGDTITVRISLHSLSDSGKRNLLEALMTNAEIAEVKKPVPEKVVTFHSVPVKQTRLVNQVGQRMKKHVEKLLSQNCFSSLTEKVNLQPQDSAS